ncbi:hypothetical protein IAQ61_004279 [Plenodomus lingam]|uniref:Uncharacterized protein n=1 Tax=Leptosphaeria maculans (strain JN3 / isolate v23.1.3 / race Av1-4-5-6-7-8) TaxID=985895 RepID=E4ZV28_LEPMJ|nr:hypothetical protein LEMA_P026060.1 [Plenodomus lingam JN3]KAH9873654.1 hypothetical protein IAQ61_004279 [Plenodomus lingam]CBX95454.1 hypothetical protein LEMA_P026060.1 [Plenodomus lingam JN3]
MAQRYMCPSMAALRRSLMAELPVCFSSRALHSSARRLEEEQGKPSNSGGSDNAAAPTTPAPTTRKDRAELALRQITNLQNRRAVTHARGLVRGSFPSGQHIAKRTARPEVDELGFLPEDGASSTQGSNGGPLRITRTVSDPAANATAPRTAAPPGGRMVRAPSQLRITRNAGRTAPGDAPRGPNLRGRDGGAPKGRSKGGDNAPKQRERKAGGGDRPPGTTVAEVNPATTLSDGMVHHLLRLQRKEWDRVQYEPKYAKGSFTANELIHMGRELFRGESPPVNIFGPLEKAIGVVGMHGAEATLQIRRVKDGDAEPFGQERPDEEVATSAKEASQTPEVAAVK